MDRGKPKGDGSICLPVVELQRLSESYGSGTTIFEPRNGMEKRDSSNAIPEAPTKAAAYLAPEKKLTLFALHLAILEKAATGLGTLGFIWATVVLLGGFAITLDRTDFWFITVILLIESTRIFSRSHELELQHQATWSITDAGVNSFRALRSSSHFIVERVKAFFRPISLITEQSRRTREIKRDSDEPGYWEGRKKPTRTWKSSDVPILPYAQWFFSSRNISRLLYWLQLASATACVILSLMKLIKHNYGDIAKGDTDKRNRKGALNIFYALALAEALLFLTEKAYCEWKLSHRKLLEEVNEECELGPSGIVSIRRFFYDAYSKCVEGSVFDGLKMDMVTFAIDLLASSSPDEQLIGVRNLRQFVQNERFSDDTLQKIGVNISVIERLIEMLNWKDPQEEEIRLSAARVLAKLAGKEQYAIRVAGVPGAMKSISSLLQTNRQCSTSADEIGEKNIIYDHDHYGFCTFSNLGLLILKKISRDPDNCGKIGNTRGLLPKIIDFTHVEERLLKDVNAAQTQILTVKRSLQLVTTLASIAGATGNHLRREILEIVFTISNVRDILRHGAKHPMLQKLGIEILTNLAIEEEGKERIGGTGGIIKELFNIFFNLEKPERHNARTVAGEALAMLALDNKSNCYRILKLKVLDRLVVALEIPVLRANAARILRNLCIYTRGDSFDQLKVVAVSAPTVLKAIMSEENKPQEVMVGLASEIFKFMTSEQTNITFIRSGVTKDELATKVVNILKKYDHPPIKVPRIRRFAIELAICMMRSSTENVCSFRNLGLERELEGVLETTTEVESFNIFYGHAGISRHGTTIHSLVEIAIELLQDR